jgi:hypothetical protein
LRAPFAIILNAAHEGRLIPAHYRSSLPITLPVAGLTR